MRTSKCNKLSIENPIQVSILNLLKVFVFVYVKLVEIEEATLSSLEKTFKCIEDGELERADCRCCVMPWGKGCSHCSEGAEGLLGRFVHEEHAPCRDEICCICSSLYVGAAVVIYYLVFELGVGEFTAVLVKVVVVVLRSCGVKTTMDIWLNKIGVYA